MKLPYFIFFNTNFQIEDVDAQCQYCDRFFPNLDSMQGHVLEKHFEHCKFCDIRTEPEVIDLDGDKEEAVNVTALVEAVAEVVEINPQVN